MKRQLGYHMIQTFIPSILLVSLAFLSFWIKELTERVALGITVVLTITTQNQGLKGDLPKVTISSR